MRTVGGPLGASGILGPTRISKHGQTVKQRRSNEARVRHTRRGELAQEGPGAAWSQEKGAAWTRTPPRELVTSVRVRGGRAVGGVAQSVGADGSFFEEL